MSSAGATPVVKPDFEPISADAIEQKPDKLDSIFAVRDVREADKRGDGAFYVPQLPVRRVITFPTLLSGQKELTSSREQLEEEINIILEMRDSDGFDVGAALYGVTVTEPLPFDLTEKSLTDLSDLPPPAVSNLRAGYLTHDDLYELRSDPGKLHDLISIFLDECKVVEVKVKSRTDQMWGYVSVRLAD